MHSFIVYEIAPRVGQLPSSGAVAVMKGLPAAPWILQFASESSSWLKSVVLPMAKRLVSKRMRVILTNLHVLWAALALDSIEPLFEASGCYLIYRRLADDSFSNTCQVIGLS